MKGSSTIIRRIRRWIRRRGRGGGGARDPGSSPDPGYNFSLSILQLVNRLSCSENKIPNITLLSGRNITNPFINGHSRDCECMPPKDIIQQRLLVLRTKRG